MPTYQVGAISDCCFRKLTLDQWYQDDWQTAGADTNTDRQWGGGMRFTNVTISQGVTINQAYLTLRALGNPQGTVCNTRISAEDADDTATFSTAADFDTRWAARTTARVDWDSIAAWVGGNDYNSPEIKTVIQEIIDRPGWVSGNSIVIFWEDFDDRSSVVSKPFRVASSYYNSAANAPKLVITYPAFIPKVSIL